MKQQQKETILTENNYQIAKKFLLKIYLLFMSTMIIFLFIYYRVIFKHAAYSLDTLRMTVDFKYLIISLMITFLHLFVLITIISSFFTKKKEYIIVIYIKKIINLLIWQPLEYFLELIAPHVPFSGTIIINYTYFFRENTYRIYLMKIICIIMYFLPRICMCLLFSIEIIITHNIEYFVKYIWILLLPIIYLIFLNLNEKFYINNLLELDKILEVSCAGEPNQHGVYNAHNFALKNKTDYYTQEDFNSLVESWSLLFYVNNLTQITRSFIAKVSLYTTLLTSSLYLCSFSYKIYYLYII